MLPTTDWGQAAFDCNDFLLKTRLCPKFPVGVILDGKPITKMSIRHSKAVEWERKLRRVFNRIDVELESEYGGRYPLHPARPEEGSTSNPSHDGLFDLGAAFSAGYGSEHGPGYIVRLRLATLRDVPERVIDEIEDRVIKRLREELPKAFPDRNLDVERDGELFKIHGDLGLGQV